MRKAPGTPDRWRWLGRLLPRDVRERVFEPAFEDLVHHWATRGGEGRHLPFGVRALSTLARCFPIALPGLFLRNGRLTRLGRVAMWSAAIFTSLALVVLNLIRPYLGYAN